MSAKLKIILLIIVMIALGTFLWFEKITWSEFAGAGVVINSVILMVETWLQKEEAKKEKAEILRTVRDAMDDDLVKMRINKSIE